MRTRLYILVLSAMLVAPILAVEARAKESDRSPKKKIQIMLVDKKERDKPGSSGRSQKPGSEQQKRR